MKIRQPKKIAVVLLLLAVLGGSVYAYQHHKEQARLAASRELTLSGNVDLREVTLAFRQSDRIADILVEEGDTVEPGQVLARLDTAETELSLQKTEAQIAA